MVISDQKKKVDPKECAMLPRPKRELQTQATYVCTTQKLGGEDARIEGTYILGNFSAWFVI